MSLSTSALCLYVIDANVVPNGIFSLSAGTRVVANPIHGQRSRVQKMPLIYTKLRQFIVQHLQTDDLERDGRVCYCVTCEPHLSGYRATKLPSPAVGHPSCPSDVAVLLGIPDLSANNIVHRPPSSVRRCFHGRRYPDRF